MSEENPATETFSLTHAIFQGLLNMTGGDVELQEPPVRSLVHALHEAKISVSNRWLVSLTEQDVQTMAYVLGVYCLNRPHLQTRFENTLGRQSDKYLKLSRAGGGKT